MNKKTKKLYLPVLIFSLFIFGCEKTTMDTPNTNALPTAPVLISPANDATDISTDVTLSWGASTDPDGDSVVYDILISTTNPPTTKVSSDQSAITYTASNLTVETDYYWMIVAKDGKGGDTSSSVGHFTTVATNNSPTAPVLMSPANDATDISTDITLSWGASTDPNGDSITYHVYLGEDKNNLSLITLRGVYVGEFKPRSLKPSTTYYWKVEVINSTGDKNSSDIGQFTTKQSLKITHSTPAEGAENVKLYTKIQITFEEDVTLAPGKIIKIQLQESTQDIANIPIEVPTEDITVSGKTITFPQFKVDFEAEPADSKKITIRMPFNRAMEVVIGENTLVGKTSNTYAEGGILQFKTQALPNQSVVRNRVSNFDKKSINWNRLSSFQQERRDNAYIQHKLVAATNEGLTGAGVNVAIIDIGIIQASEVFSALTFSSIDLEDQFTKYDIDDKTVYNHGTQMARYLLGYAPGTNILDFNKNWRFFKVVDGGENINLLALIKSQNIDIANLSGTDGQVVTADLKPLIDDGLIFAHSIGNIIGIESTPQSYRTKEVFFPYFFDLKNAKGAFVTVQAVSDYVNTQEYTTNRSHVGSTRFYTISMLENANGATSEATANFSGVMALMLEANKKDNKGYSPRELVEIVFQTAKDIGDSGVDVLFGHGLVDIEAALNYLKKGAKPTFKLYEQDMDEGVAQALGNTIKQ